MAENTLLFEDIARSDIVVTTNRVDPFPGRPTNNATSSDLYRIKIQVSRENPDTVTNYVSSGGGIPVCAYHMPRNSQRQNDPALYIPRKNVGDIIEASDLNKLFDRINVMIEVWNAELNDPFGYGITSIVRTPAARNYATLINSSVPDDLSTPQVTNGTSTTHYDQVYFFQYRGEDFDDVLHTTHAAKNHTFSELATKKEYYSHPMGSPMKYKFPVSGQISDLTSPETSEFTVQDQVYTTIHYNTGKTKLAQANLEFYRRNGDSDEFTVVMGRSDTGVPEYWECSWDGGATFEKVIFGIDTINIFSYRDIDEDPLDPKLYYVGTTVYTLAKDPDIYAGIDNVGASNRYTINESDISFNEVSRYKRGSYPIITPTTWTQTRLTIDMMLRKIESLANTAFSGQVDSITKIEMDAFRASQIATTTTIDPDDPQVTFDNYYDAAKTGHIIKVDFYNTLVDAYRLMINSCVCNTDCYCNVDCICNTNCGCNY